MKPAIVARKNQNDPVKRISNGNLKAKYVCPSTCISLSEKNFLFHTIILFCFYQVIVQNSRKIRNRIRRKYFKDLEKRRQQQRRKRQRLHRAKKLEQIRNRKKNLTAEITDDVIDYQVHRRSRRSVSSPRHVEALVVADTSMVSFHQDGDVEMYLLTIMNMVSSLYKDPAIGNLIKVVVIRIVLLEEEEAHPDFNVTHAAEGNLRNFCR